MNATPDISMFSGAMAGGAAAHRGRGPHAPSTPASASRFDALVRRAERAGTEVGPADGDGSARESAEELIAFGLIAPLLKMARNDPFKSELFHGGQGEKAFGNQLDQRIARHIVDGMNLPIVDAVHRRITAGQGGEVDQHG